MRDENSEFIRSDGDRRMKEERTALHWAATQNDLKVLSECLANGDDPDTADDGGWTPLISAASAGYAHCVGALLEAGANTKLTTSENRTAFFYAVSRCNVQVVDLMIQNEAIEWKKDKTGSTALHRAICCPKCTPEFLEMLTRADPPFDVADREGNLPIHVACSENRNELVLWLVANAGGSLDGPANSKGKAPRDLIPSQFH
jgi:26S proteasome non-ATPase regulatory subunit 10